MRLVEILIVLLLAGLRLAVSGDSIVLFSAMDEAYIPKYANYTASKLDYCQRHNYKFLYRPTDFGFEDDSSVHPNYFRIHAAIRLLKGEVPGVNHEKLDYIVYIDADAYVVEKGLPFESFIDAVQNYVASSVANKDECYFITQDYHHGINSGFWLLKNTPWSIKFLKDWLESCQKESKYKFNWVFDQGPLQNVILEHAALIRNVTYNDDCWANSKYDHAANLCWLHLMTKWQYPFEQRKVGHICLLPSNRGIPLRHHMHGIHKPGELIRHQKGLSGERIAADKNYFRQINASTGSERNFFHFLPGSLLRHHHSKEIFIIQEDDKKHLIPNGQTFLAMGLEFHNVISVSDDLFSSISLGSAMPSLK